MILKNWKYSITSDFKLAISSNYFDFSFSNDVIFSLSSGILKF